MKTLIVPVEETERRGYTLATQVLWPIHGPPLDSLLVIAPDTEDFPLAYATARHWGSLTRKRTSQAVWWAVQNGDPVPPKIAEQMRKHQPVIVASRIDRHNVNQVVKLKVLLEKTSGGPVTVGALENDTGKYDGLVVRTPPGA